ncbi:MAG: CoA transferase, partial [Chloroflexi bacterium]|nr:CoA transferase [Chloroflexota bacterium]
MGALDGITVLDLSRVLAGPFCTQTLSDLGATVWKIESPWGDDTRRWGPPFTDGESAYFLSTNRGKKSVIANLRDERGRRIVQRLAEKADVLVENFKVGDLARYGLEYETLSATNPRLIYASITGYGQTGPRAPEPGYDAALQGLTGIMSVTGEADGPPMRVGVAWIDLLTGMTATVGILAALNERHTSGQGQYIDVSLFDVGLASMVNIAQAYLATGVSPMRMGTAHPQIVPYQSFEASDGPFFLAVGNDDQYRRLVEAIGHDELWQDARYRTNEGRVGHRDELIPELTVIFSGGTREKWLGIAESAGVPSSPINTGGEGLTDPHAIARAAVWTVPHPKLG